MAHRSKTATTTTLARLRLVAIGVCTAAFFLIGQIVFAGLTQAQSGLADSADHPALTIGETLFGPGSVRVTDAANSAPLILVNAPLADAADIKARFKPLLDEALPQIGNSADYTIEVYPFATGLTGAFTADDFAVLTILFLMAAASGWIAVQLTQTERKLERETSLKPANDMSDSPDTAKEPSQAAAFEQLSELAENDPAKLARVIHTWLEGERA